MASTNNSVASPPTTGTSATEGQHQHNTPVPPPPTATDAAQDEEVVEADEDDVDSAFGSIDNSETTSIASSIYAGYIENGRRYQTVREGEYWGPSDEKQFESMQASHIVHLILDSKASNNLFYSPISSNPQNILDIGTGNGAWAVAVADKYPSAVVQAIDLYPPPETWVPPNCRFEVDDALKTWTYKERFDLIHMRDMFGAFTDSQWTGVYKQAYENLMPGGWIEQVEPGIIFFSDDGTLPSDSLLADWGPISIKICAKTGKNIDTVDHFRQRIEAAGFTSIHEKRYKIPLGEWAKNPVFKEAGKFHKAQLLAGMEGYVMFVMTHFGEPEPWTPEAVQVYLAKVRNEIETGGFHAYTVMKRVWAQKPHGTEPKTAQKSEVEAVA